jgi:hypothetical protein
VLQGSYELRASIDAQDAGAKDMMISHFRHDDKWEETRWGQKPMDTPGRVHVLIRSLRVFCVVIWRLGRVSNRYLGTRSWSILYPAIGYKRLTYSMFAAFLSSRVPFFVKYISYIMYWFYRLRTGNVLFNYKHCKKFLKSEGSLSLPNLGLFPIALLVCIMQCHLS